MMFSQCRTQIPDLVTKSQAVGAVPPKGKIGGASRAPRPPPGRPILHNIRKNNLSKRSARAEVLGYLRRRQKACLDHFDSVSIETPLDRIPHAGQC